MPSNSQSFIRQKTYYMPKSINNSSTADALNGSKKPNQQQQTGSESTQQNAFKSNGFASQSDENCCNNAAQPTTSQTATLTVSLSTADLTSNLPTNLTTSSKTKSYTYADDKLCKFDFKTSWLRYLIHLRFLSTKSGKIYLHRDIRILILRKNEFDPGNLIGTPSFHWVTEQITEQQTNNPKYLTVR